MLLPWQIPVNQLAAEPARADLTLALGCVGGAIAFGLMLWRMSRREVPA
jgi:ABC-2 type transport system permease protein